MVTIIKSGSGEKDIDKLLSKLFSNVKSKTLDAFKFCGVLKLNSDSLKIQKDLRDEWE